MMTIKNESELDMTGLMLFDAKDGYGAQVVNVITEYQRQSGQQVDGKTKSTKQFLVDQPNKPSAAKQVRTFEAPATSSARLA